MTFKLDQKYIDTLEEEKSKFKLQIKSPTALKVKDNFLKYYSGGPEKNDDNTPLIVPYQLFIFCIKKIDRIIKSKIFFNYIP